MEPPHEPDRAGTSHLRVAPAELDSAASPWNRAAGRTAVGDPFCCRTEWQLSAFETFPPRRRPCILSDGDNVAAFAERRHEVLGAVLEPFEAHWYFGCPLLGDGAIDLLQAFLSDPRAWPSTPNVIVSGLLPRSGPQQKLVRRFLGRFQIFALEPNVMRSASLDGGVDGFLSRRSAHFRRNLRSAERRALAAGVYFERHQPGTPGDADAVYRRMIAIERASWKGIGRCGMAEPPSLHFYAVMMRRLAATGGGLVVFARHDDRDIGFIFGGLAGRVYRGQQFSYDEAWASASIGNLLQLAKLRWLCELGVERYDMGPVMEYKRHWTEIETTLDCLLLRTT